MKVACDDCTLPYKQIYLILGVLWRNNERVLTRHFFSELACSRRSIDNRVETFAFQRSFLHYSSAGVLISELEKI